MLRHLTLLCSFWIPATGWAQPEARRRDESIATAYHPTPLSAADYGFSWRHASTVTEANLRGVSAWIHALGNFAVNSEQAAILRQHAWRLELAKRYDLVQWNDSQRGRRAGRLESKRRKNLETRPERFRQAYELTSDELNRSTGIIRWPLLLQAQKYEQRRSKIEELFRRQYRYDRTIPCDARAIEVACDQLIRESDRNRSLVDAGEHVAAQRFLRGLKYEPLFRQQLY